MSEIAPPSATTSAPRKPRARRLWALALVVILALIPLQWLMFQGEERVPGVITRPLGPCDVDWFKRRNGAIILACPHTDLIKLWPLPVEQPWWEHFRRAGLWRTYRMSQSPSRVKEPQVCEA